MSKLLASSGLLITLEVQVFSVADKWLNFNIKERSKYDKNILIKVRLNLRSQDSVGHFLNGSKI